MTQIDQMKSQIGELTARVENLRNIEAHVQALNDDLATIPLHDDDAVYVSDLLAGMAARLRSPEARQIKAPKTPPAKAPKAAVGEWVPVAAAKPQDVKTPNPGDKWDALGGSIRTLRTLKGLSQRELAAKAGVGKTQVSRCELGEFAPDHPPVKKIVAALGTTVGKLV